MHKKIKILLLLLLIIIPINVFAISKDYVDKLYEITNTELEDGKINLYLFHGEECPHCEEERNWLREIEKKYDNLNIYMFEVWHDKENLVLLEDVLKKLNSNSNSIPFTVIGDSYFVGFSSTTKSLIENKICEYLELDNNENQVKIPILGTVNMKDVSVPIVAIVLGFVDGFNPCAMWILLFLINLLFGIKDKKKSWLLGFTFLFISGFVYFMSMLGINFILGIATIKWLKILIALFILIAGLFNLRKYFKTRKEEAGCSVVDNKKRKKIITRMKKIINSKSFIFALFGIIILAISVNLVELACSLGFPLIFTEILTINNIGGITRIIYLLLYILFYMLDDIIVFSISMITLNVTGITNKYNKLCTLVSAIIMIIMGILLLLKPEWLMLNF